MYLLVITGVICTCVCDDECARFVSDYRCVMCVVIKHVLLPVVQISLIMNVAKVHSSFRQLIIVLLLV